MKIEMLLKRNDAKERKDQTEKKSFILPAHGD